MAREVGGGERRCGPLARRPRALRRGPHRRRDAAAVVGPRGPRGPAPRGLRLRREHEAARPGRGAPLDARRGRPSRRDRRRRASVPGVPPPREGPRPTTARSPRRASPSPCRLSPPRQKKVEPGQPWAGTTALAARLRALGDLPADAPAPDAADGTPSTRGALVDAVKRFQGRHALEPDGVIGRRHDRRRSTSPRPPACGRSSWPSSASAGCPRLRKRAARLRQRAALPALGLRPRSAGRAAAHERRGRQDARARDADLRRADGVRDLPALLEPAAEHHPQRDRAEGAARPVLPRARRTWRSWRAATRAPRPSPPPRRTSTRSSPGSSSSARSRARRTRSASPSSSSRTPRTSTCTARPRSRSSPAPGATSATAASGSRTRPASPSGCCATRPEWTRERIDAAMQGDRPTQVNLKQKLTVFLFYDTAYVDSKGVVYFADDYYGHDAQLEKALAPRLPLPAQELRRGDPRVRPGRRPGAEKLSVGAARPWPMIGTVQRQARRPDAAPRSALTPSGQYSGTDAGVQDDPRAYLGEVDRAADVLRLKAMDREGDVRVFPEAQPARVVVGDG